MWLLAQTWKTRPSEFLAIADPLTAFYFDRAVTTFGKEVEAAMDEAAEGAKTGKDAKRRRQLALTKFMKTSDGSHVPGTFRDPAAAARQ